MALVQSSEIMLHEALAQVRAALPAEDDWLTLKDALKARTESGHPALPSVIVEHDTGDRFLAEPWLWEHANPFSDTASKVERDRILVSRVIPVGALRYRFIIDPDTSRCRVKLRSGKWVHGSIRLDRATLDSLIRDGLVSRQPTGQPAPAKVNSPRRGQARRYPMDDVRDWYRRRVSEYADMPPPSRDDDLVAARGDRFPSIDREQMRQVRKDVAPHWTVQGRPRGA